MATELLQDYRDEIEQALARALAGDGPLRSALRYHVGLEGDEPAATRSMGKLLRPSLVMFVGERFGAPRPQLLAAATALELVHNFSLIHDDIQDRDTLRRGRATVWSLHGWEQAINAGDLMHALAISVSLTASPAAAARLLDATVEMIEGQALDLRYEQRMATTDEYLTMVDRKTGALLRCAFDLGALLAGESDATRAILASLGQAVGQAFQIKDDILGIWGTDDVLGKATGSDIRRGKKTLPIILLHERSTREDAERLAQALHADTPTDDQITHIVERLDDVGVRSECEATVDAKLQHALELTGQLPIDEEGRAMLKQLIEYLGRRER